jgi:hypothetical protein
MADQQEVQGIAAAVFFIVAGAERVVQKMKSRRVSARICGH